MNLCKYARQESGRNKKIYCDKTGGPCGHVWFCELSCKYKQTAQAKNCPLGKDEKE